MFKRQKMDFQTMREELQIKHQDVYVSYDGEKQNLDSFSFNQYPDKQRTGLIKFYKEARPILAENGFLDHLSIMNDSFRSYPLKNFYSSLIPISQFRNLYKWLGIEDKTITNEEIVTAQRFLLENWQEKDFFPFMTLNPISSALVIQRTNGFKRDFFHFK